MSEVLTADCYEETIDALANQLSLDSGLILVAEVDQQVVGVIIGTVDDNKGYYYRLAIDVSHRNRGIGRTLIRHLDKRFQNRKVNKIMIALDRHNEHLRSFYESLGYQAKDFMSGIASLRIVNG
ncbi:GNAT family N-acetyltransferase [Insulibacter thermoxylanivorax]|uniref:GNAT family N-acetyltransferase n=1 Tax=Insulibacter thermoxylanivorax TaxID=2749268 RepID=UPI00280AB237|nr:GNAT family N-acetyltransferase [Insulibacter thermoxylanivorax]